MVQIALYFQRLMIICAGLILLAMLAMVFFGGAAAEDEQESDPWREAWALLIQTEGGSISITRNLTKYECEFALNRALGFPATDEERQARKEVFNAINKRREAWAQENSCRMEGWETSAISFVTDNGVCVFGHDLKYPGTGMRIIRDSDIKRAECFISPDR